MIRNCPLCEQNNTAASAAVYSRADWRIKTCGRCSFVYLENPPDYSELQADFPWEKTFTEEKSRRFSDEPLWHRLSNFMKRVQSFLNHRLLKRDKLRALLCRHLAKGDVLDVGCSVGDGFRRLAEHGFVPSGVEISKHLASLAAPRAAKRGGKVVVGNACDGLGHFADGHFTGAVLNSFLEHESQPLQLLSLLSRKLARNGAIILKVPNFQCWNRTLRGARWCGFRFPDHVNYFTPRTLTEMVTRAGFRIARFSWRDRFPFSDNMWMVCQAA